MKLNKLLDKYYNGTSTLEEEKLLHAQSDDLLLTAINNYNQPDFDTFKNSVAQNLHAENKYRKLKIIAGIAAAILLGFISLGANNYLQNQIAVKKVEAIFNSQEHFATLEMSHQMLSKLTQLPNFIEVENKPFSIPASNIKIDMPTLSRLEHNK